MKKLFFSALLLSTFVISCTTDSQIVEEDSANLTLDIALNQIIEQSTNSDTPIQFEIAMLPSGEVQLGDAIDVSENFEENFMRGFNTEVSFSKIVPQQRITMICCTIDGEDQGCAECNDDDGLCIAVAINGCLNDNGCAEVCRRDVQFVPSLKTFFIR